MRAWFAFVLLHIFKRTTMINLRLLQSTEQLSTCKPRRYGHSYLVKLPNSKSFVVIGPHWLGVVTTSAIIIGATIMNIKYIKQNSKLTLFTSFLLYSIVVVGFISTNVFLWLTALSDPGILFKCDLPADNEYTESAQRTLLPQRSRRFYCEECNMLEPRGVFMEHCQVCGYCIENMDHHCPWMGQCIGKKNMKWFVLFNISWVLYFVEFLFTAIVLRF